MSRMHDADADAHTHAAADVDGVGPPDRRADDTDPTDAIDAIDGGTTANPWWRHLAVIALLLALTRVGFYFAGVVAMLLVLTDLRRNSYARLGGAVLALWWTFVWARASVPPLIGFGMLMVAAGSFAVAAQQARRPVRSVLNAGLAALSLGFAVLNIAPYGRKPARIGESEALNRALAASRNDVRATHAQVVSTRERFTQRPLLLVLLFEPNEKAETTADGELCFRREEVHVVDGLTGAVDARGIVDRLTLAPSRYQLAEARVKDGNCLPLPRGTSLDIDPIPGR